MNVGGEGAQGFRGISSQLRVRSATVLPPPTHTHKGQILREGWALGSAPRHLLSLFHLTSLKTSKGTLLLLHFTDKRHGDVG